MTLIAGVSPSANPARTIGSSEFRSTAICTTSTALPPSESVTRNVTVYRPGCVKCVRRRIVRRCRPVAEVPRRGSLRLAAERHGQRRDAVHRRRRDLDFRPQLLAGGVGDETVSHIGLGRLDRVLARLRRAQRQHGHLPRIDQIDLVRPVAGQLDRLRIRSGAVQQVVLAGLGQQVSPLIVAQRLQFVERPALRP